MRILRDDWPKNGPYVSSVHLTLHAGTHADAPLHYDAGASDIAGLGLTPFIGLCFVLELPEGHESIDAPLLERLPAHTRRVLFKTPASGLNGQAYIESGYGLTARAARRIGGGVPARRGGRAFGGREGAGGRRRPPHPFVLGGGGGGGPRPVPRTGRSTCCSVRP